MKSTFIYPLLAAAITLHAARANPPPELWALAEKDGATHRFSTLLSAQDVRDHLSSDSGIDSAIRWCKDTGVTKVYIEEYRDGYQADRETLLHAKNRFRDAGLLVSGCVTTTRVGKFGGPGMGSGISCYTDLPTQERVKSIFEYAAGLFDEIMIDDFWFTECTCSNCDTARRSQTVTIGSKTYPVSGNTWSDCRRELMLRVSEDDLLSAAKRINPKARLIIKYPEWDDRFQDRGYDVARETTAFDRIWVGTETRDPTNSRWGKLPQYQAYFLMRWLGGIGGKKCGGGWYDSFGTSPLTYIEQARQTVLAGARESMLFSFGSLQHDGGPADVDALRTNIPELLSVAGEIRRRDPIGIAAYKPANSDPRNESRVFDYVGMIGVPLVPCDKFPSKAPAIFVSAHALADPGLAGELSRYIQTGRPVLMTDGLANGLGTRVNTNVPNVVVLNVTGKPDSLYALPQNQLDELRAHVLKPFKASLRAPNRVALYLFTHGGWVIENFNDEPVDVTFNGQPMHIAARAWNYRWN
jgi:hypothetical protein